MLQLIHISDTHIGPTPEFQSRQVVPYGRMQRLVQVIRSLDFTADLIIHSGDVVDDPNEDSYELAAQIFSELDLPLCFAPGNHDDSLLMQQYLPGCSQLRRLTKDTSRLTEIRSLPGLDVLILDCWVPPSDGPHGELPDDQLQAVRRHLDASDTPVLLVVHFPPLPLGSAWIDEHLLLRNGPELHELLRSYGPKRVRGVLFGHVHRGIQQCRDGIFYSGVSSPLCQFSCGVYDPVVSYEAPCPVAFNHITLDEAGGVTVKEHTLLPLPIDGSP